MNGERSAVVAWSACQAVGPTASSPSSISTFTRGVPACRSQVVARTGRRDGVGALLVAGGVVHRLVHRLVEVVAEIVAHLLPHLLHEPGDAGGVVVIDVPEVGGIGEGLQTRIFGLDGGEAGHHARQRGAVAAGTSWRLGGGWPQDEDADHASTVAAVVLINRHRVDFSTRVRRVSPMSAYRSGRPEQRLQPRH